MIKQFIDVKKDDLIYIVCPEKYEVVGHKVLKRSDLFCSSGFYRFIVEDYIYFITAPIYQTRAGKYTFTTKEQATEFLIRAIQDKNEKLEKQIDQKVKEYDCLSDFLRMVDEVDEIKDSTYFKDIKAGDHIFWINKVDLKVEVIGVQEIKKKKSCYQLLEIESERGPFTAYPGSTKSLSNEFYTNSDRAFISLIRYVEKRVKTVGNKMEKLMKELERNEKFLDENIWRFETRR